MPHLEYRRIIMISDGRIRRPFRTGKAWYFASASFLSLSLQWWLSFLVLDPLVDTLNLRTALFDYWLLWWGVSLDEVWIRINTKAAFLSMDVRTVSPDPTFFSSFLTDASWCIQRSGLRSNQRMETPLQYHWGNPAIAAIACLLSFKKCCNMHNLTIYVDCEVRKEGETQLDRIAFKALTRLFLKLVLANW